MNICTDVVQLIMVIITVPILFYNLNKRHFSEFKNHRLEFIVYTVALIGVIYYDFHFDVYEEYILTFQDKDIQFKLSKDQICWNLFGV